ncbi:MAG: hypothetical protein GY861_13965 [bacterium]|nr:hypothetical protein [bacterium]
MELKGWHEKAQKEFFKRMKRGDIKPTMSSVEWEALKNEIYAKCKVNNIEYIVKTEPVIVKEKTKEIISVVDNEDDKLLIVSLQNELDQTKEVLAEKSLEVDSLTPSIKTQQNEINELQGKISALNTEIKDKDTQIVQANEGSQQMRERLEIRTNELKQEAIAQAQPEIERLKEEAVKGTPVVVEKIKLADKITAWLRKLQQK